MAEHADIGPSSLYRLLACPGSHKLSKTRQRGGSSVYAAEGTVAHEICEECLNDGKRVPAEYLGEKRSADGHDFIVDQEMVDGCTMYVEHCRSLIPEKGWYKVEQRVDLAKLWTPGEPPEAIFGTADFVAHFTRDNRMAICDLKYGRGDIDPTENPQAMAYALGAVLTFGIMPSDVDIYIVQPRGQQTQGVKHWRTTGLDLMMWGWETLMPGVDAFMDPSAKLVPGDHCKFCPVLAVCPALRKLAQDTSREEFHPVDPPGPNTLSDDELAYIMNRVAIIKPWLDAVQAEVSGRIDRGAKIPGWKLVPKRAVRTWEDKNAVTKWMLERGLEDVTMNTVPKTPTQVEKEDPEIYDALYRGGFINDKSSGTTLVPDLDPREALIQRSAKDEFSAK